MNWQVEKATDKEEELGLRELSLGECLRDIERLEESLEQNECDASPCESGGEVCLLAVFAFLARPCPSSV